jgi:hypothetical protein
MLPCRACGTTDSTAFYETSASRYCKACRRERYGGSRYRDAKLARATCVDCGLVATPETLCMFDLDHREDKCFNVSQMYSAPDDVFQKELEKCDLVCANCHRLRTKARGYLHCGRPRKVRPIESHTSLSPAPF